MNDPSDIPQTVTRRVAVLAFPNCEILDVCGPLEVFAFVGFWFQMAGRPTERPYACSVLAAEPGPVTTMSGLQIVADHGIDEVGEDIDTLLIAGGIGVDDAKQERRLVDWIRQMEGRVRRIGSICTGTFLLAEAGLLNGCRATTHWYWCRQLGREYPEIRVEPDQLAVRDGKKYSSGGVTAGMDLALAMVEEDLGPEITSLVGRWLLVFPNRPGGQSQFSAHLHKLSHGRKDFQDLQNWINSHPDADLSVDALADRVSMSPRHFARVFEQEIGLTPAKFVELSRIERARACLEQTRLPVDAIAAECGFSSAEHLRRSFQRTLRVSPLEYRARFRRPLKA